ncbi:MAG: hypothetical protein MSH15_04780 [Oscillospiraceae bacterium]|nr:hypothetical protein [Oscillospiraceae bacterium]
MSVKDNYDNAERNTEYYPEIYTACFDENGIIEYVTTYRKKPENKEKLSYTAREIYNDNDNNGKVRFTFFL